LIASVQAEHIARLDIPIDDLKPRPFRPKRRPKTALISDAIAIKMIRREIQRLRGRKEEVA
jgi:hypothetical protein